jgi:hypothetical protein
MEEKMMEISEWKRRLELVIHANMDKIIKEKEKAENRKHLILS